MGGWGILSVPVNPIACLRTLRLWGKTKVLHYEERSQGNSIVAQRNVTGDSRTRERTSLCPQHSQLSEDTQAPACRLGDGHTHIHKRSFESRFVFHTRTHTAWCQRALRSRSLDDVVKQLHRLHDVLVLHGDKRLR